MGARDGYALEADEGAQGVIPMELDKLEKVIAVLSESVDELRNVVTTILEDPVPMVKNEEEKRPPETRGGDSEVARRIRNVRETAEVIRLELAATMSRTQV